MNLTIANALRRTLLQHGDAVGYIDRGRSHTFNDLEQRSDRLAGMLHCARPAFRRPPSRLGTR